MSCYEVYQKGLDTAVIMIQESTSTHLPWLRELIMEHVYDNYHIGHLRPIYYINGIPSTTWVCTKCKGLITHERYRH